MAAGAHAQTAVEAAAGITALDDSKRSFLRMVSHELRTPLNAVIGFAEIISGELHGPIGDPRYAAHAEVIRESGLKLLKLVNQVLEIARLEAGAADLDLRPELPAAAVQAAWREVSAEADAKGVELQTRIDGDAGAVLADARGLQTVLAHLLQNAVTYSPPDGTVEVRVRAGRGAVLFEVRDRGAGLAAAELQRVMRPFEQAENALVRRGKGAGLGLAIVSLLCREMGGLLALRSSPGRGLTARVRLPAADLAAACEGELEAARSAA